jgi:hypothetical protein
MLDVALDFNVQVGALQESLKITQRAMDAQQEVWQVWQRRQQELHVLQR